MQTPARPPMRHLLAPLTLALALVLPAAAQALQLHRPSPDWRDQVLYFVMTDRFDDGDPGNNDQGHGEYRPGSAAHFNGGDFAGLRRRLDYIQGLGATGVWITPPVLNQWWDGHAQYGGYHGYWAADFRQVDPHLGTLADYRALSDALHRRGMTLVQDIVVNHMGNFFAYDEGWRADDPAAGWQDRPLGRPFARPPQAPFAANDPRSPAQRALGIYHWTPDVRDYADRRQVLDWQMSGLDDLNTGNPQVRRALRDAYGFWIREVGVDAFRIDTAFYVPPAFFDDFLHARDPAAPGIARVARQTGRERFLNFGEGFAIDRAFEDRQARRIEAYATAPGGRPRLDGMLNFPLYGSLGTVLARGAPTAELAHRIGATMRVHRDPHRMANFVDNHDVDRFLAGGSEAALKQALFALMTLPGIPVVYYGTEQGFTRPRAAMFAAGVDSGGRDRFDTAAPLYRWLQGAIALRRGHPVLSRGWPTVLRGEAAGPGVLAWRMDPPRQGPDAALEPLLVLMNTAERPALLDAVPTGARGARMLAGVYALDGTPPPPARTQADGTLTLVLPPRSAQVFRLGAPPGPPPGTPPGPATPPRAPTLEALAPVDEGLALQARGRARPGAALQLVADGDLSQAVTAQADAQGRWAARLDTRRWNDARVPHRVVAWQPDDGLSSAPRTLRLQRPWRLLAQRDDPAGDDHGPAGQALRLSYPTDPSWGANRQMDLRGLRVWGAGDALRLELPMHRVTQSWNPANGFDHVAFTIFIGHDRREGGARAMPLQDGELPEGMRWHWRLRVHGWSNALFSSEGASTTHEGTPLAGGAAVEVDAARHVVRLTLPGGVFGSLQGLQLYVTTWDYDGGYRALQATAGPHRMGGGPGPKVMDDLGPLRLP